MVYPDLATTLMDSKEPSNTFRTSSPQGSEADWSRHPAPTRTKRVRFLPLLRNNAVPQQCRTPQRAPDEQPSPGMVARKRTGLTVKWPLDQRFELAVRAEMLPRSHESNSRVTCSFAGRAIVQQRRPGVIAPGVTRTLGATGSAARLHRVGSGFESLSVHQSQVPIG